MPCCSASMHEGTDSSMEALESGLLAVVIPTQTDGIQGRRAKRLGNMAGDQGKANDGGISGASTPTVVGAAHAKVYGDKRRDRGRRTAGGNENEGPN